jgi:hypothetical protein
MTVPIAESDILWRFLNGRQEAYCVMRPHPTAGMEVLYVYNGVHLIGVVSTDLDELHQRARQWRMRLVAEGWVEGERRLRPETPTLKSRRAGAKV